MPDSSSDGFALDADTLRALAADALAHARELGASSAEVDLSEGYGQSVTVRRGDVETIEYNRDKGMGVTVYLGQRRGHASTSDFSPRALRDTVAAAVSIARHTAEDPFAGLADADLLATEFPDLDLYHPWELSVASAIEQARACEAAALAVDRRIDNTEGATVSTQASRFVYANSLGFRGGYPGSRHSISCSVIGREGEEMQRDDWYTMARAPGDLEAAEQVGRRAGERAVARLGSRKLPTAHVPVLYEAPVAASLLGHFAAAASGGNLYRKSSFLLGRLGEQLFPAHVTIRDLAHLPRALGSSAFDDEGVATRDRAVVQAGRLEGWFLGSYSARKLGLRSTGNAGGSHNLVLEPTGEDFPALLRKLGRGLLVTELLGQGVNMVTGDYSRGAAGFWVEDGEIAYPVHEITVAGNLLQMYAGLVAAGSDVLARGARQCGSVLVERMTVAGA
ncbi:MAG: metalloprotease PmbA [Betaproteobacteria bacterium]|nr:metalloprotease PmbA [Rhodocyclaceae bacterium]MCA3132997.1 metalloprotease PmbA [Rhodocyclaceae bacterium]MCA3144832.1 metalloprotease PmbA [Rhodocyclaceae bacterium]